MILILGSISPSPPHFSVSSLIFVFFPFLSRGTSDHRPNFVKPAWGWFYRKHRASPARNPVYPLNFSPFVALSYLESFFS